MYVQSLVVGGGVARSSHKPPVTCMQGAVAAGAKGAVQPRTISSSNNAPACERHFIQLVDQDRLCTCGPFSDLAYLPL